MQLLLWLLVVVVVRCDRSAVVVVEQQSSCPEHSVGVLLKDGVSYSCDFQENVVEYFVTISWKPLNVSDLAGYMVYTKYGGSMRCVNLTAEKTNFEMFEQEGFEKGHDLSYAVVALFKVDVQTVTEVTLTEAGKCPIVSKVKPLPNEIVAPGSAFSFRCVFEGDDPVPRPILEWTFTSDRTNCNRNVRKLRNTSDIQVSYDKQEVTILKATTKHIGCYILNVGYSIKSLRIKGYLALQKRPPHPNEGGVSPLAETISLVLGGVVLVGFAVAAAMHVRCVRRRITLTVREGEETFKKVYVCHVTEEDDEAELIQFLGILKSFNVQTIVDLDSRTPPDACSVEAVEENMTMSDKILVLLSPSFMSWITACHNCNGRKTVCRAHTELRFISTMLYDETKQLTKELVIVSKGVKPRNFPAVLANRAHLTFPVRCTADPDEDYDEDLRRIMCALVDREPELSSNGYHNL